MRRAAPALLALVLAVALAGCGGDEDAKPEARDSAAALVAAAGERTQGAGSYRTTFRISLEDVADEPIAMKGRGLFDAEDRIGRMTFDMSELGPSVGEASFIFDESALYMRFPAVTRTLPKEKPWVRFDVADFDKEAGANLAELAQLAQSDPARALQFLRGAAGDVEEVGKENVRGEPTTHLSMTVDLEKVAKQAPGQRANIDRVVELSGVKEVPADVWIDGEGRVRRMKLVYPEMQVRPKQKTDIALTMELFDFGVKVDVEPPPTAQVIDIGEILGRGAEETEHSEPGG